MKSVDTIRQRREEILDELGKLEFVRRGSVADQFLNAKGKNGRRYRCGPYSLYTVKRQGKTVSRRLHGDDVVRYREQVQACHRAQALTSEWIELGEALCDLSKGQDAVKKTPSI